jgi:hypothetical protein
MNSRATARVPATASTELRLLARIAGAVIAGKPRRIYTTFSKGRQHMRDQPSKVSIPDRLQRLVPWLGLALGAGSFIFTLYSNNLQNAKWAMLNQPRFELMPPFLVAFEELDFHTASSRHWGYKPLLFTVMMTGADALDTGRYRLYCDLKLFTSPDGIPISGTKTMHTVEDAEDEIKRLNLHGKIVVLKHIQTHFNFRNAGTLPATNVSVRIVHLLEPTRPQEVFSSKQPVKEIGAGETFNSVADWYMPLNVSLPDELPFRVSIDFNGGQAPWTRLLRYEATRNYWTW